MSEDSGLLLLFVVLFVVLAALYFLPSIIAFFRSCPKGAGIFFLNLLTGWSFVGWIVAFVWACVDDRRSEKVGKK